MEIDSRQPLDFHKKLLAKVRRAMRARLRNDDGVDIIRMSEAEYLAAVRHSLAELGLAYGELAAQARARRFSSADAADLWILILETIPTAACA